MIIPLIRRTNNIVNAAVCVRGGTIPPKKGIVNCDSSGIDPPILVARFPKTGIVYRGSSGIVCVCVCVCVCSAAKASGEYYDYLAFDYGGLEKGRKKEEKKAGLASTSHRPRPRMRTQVHTFALASRFEEKILTQE